MDGKDLIKQKLNIVDIIGEYLTLKKAGSNYKGICPFHSEKSPSFMVNEDRQTFHCFGCNEGGDMFSFIQKIENFDFPEALEFLANKAGVELKPIDNQKKNEKRGLAEVNELAARFYHQVLMVSAPGKRALDYLHQRQLTDDTIKNWQIGFSPDSWDSLIKALKTKGISEQIMVTLGLVTQKDGGKVFDRFRKRIMFPIRDVRGQVVGFTSRIIDKEDEQFGGKYVNTAQTPLYNKSEVLFGLDRAKETIRKAGYAVMVEGNMDVIMSHQAGVTSAIATSGTALTSGHLKILKRYTDKIHFCFDSDAAGRLAFLRALAIAQQEEFDSFVVILPSEVNGKEVKDPDDLARNAPQEWAKAVANPIPAIEYLLAQCSEQYRIGTDAGINDALEFLLPIIHNFKNKIQQDYWLAKIAQRFSINQSHLLEKFNELKPKEKKVENKVLPPAPALKKISKSRLVGLEEHLFAMISNWPEYIPAVSERLDLSGIEDVQLNSLYKQLFSYYNSAKEFEHSSFFKYLEATPDLYNQASTMSFMFAELIDAVPQEHRHREIERVISTIEYLLYKQELSRLQLSLASAEAKGDSDMIQSLMSKISEYNHLLNESQHGSN